MDAVFNGALPYIHPIAVHFPIGLLSAALLVAIAWLVTGRRFYRLSLLMLLVLGLAGGVFALFSGRAMTVTVAPDAADLLSVHAASSNWMLILGLTTLVIHGAFNFYLERRTTIMRHPPDPLWMRLVVFAGMLGTWITLAASGYTGHLMVWGIS